MAVNPIGTVIFINGLFLGNNCWDDWRSHFESKGYKTLAPSWPHKEGSAAELRSRHPDPSIASNRLAGLKDYFAAIACQMPEQPILIGHSLGGLIVQWLLQAGVGSAGVAIHSFPPRSISALDLSFLSKWWATMGLLTSSRKTCLPSPMWWRHVITNGMSAAQQQTTYFRHALPESKMIIRDTFSQSIPFDFAKPQVPLLFTSGSDDRLIPAHVNYRNYKMYEGSGSLTEYKEFKFRPHFVFAPSLWIEEADFILYWLHRLGK